jgi:hypothetical protein
MNTTLWFVFYFRLPDGRKVETEIVGTTFEECLKNAQRRATNANAKIISWTEV